MLVPEILSCSLLDPWLFVTIGNIGADKKRVPLLYPYLLDDGPPVTALLPTVGDHF